MFPRYDLLLFLLAQLNWAVPTHGRVTLNHRSLSGHTPCRLPNMTSDSSETVAATWYAGWNSNDFTLQDLSWSKYSVVIYAFAETSSDVNVLSLTDSDRELLPQFVHTAHKNNVKAMISVGGWTGSRYFSSAVATGANRTAFAKTVMSFVSMYKLDGVEFDWEFPAQQGIGCNLVSVNDTANFLTFLQTLRGQDVTQDLIVSAAVSTTPFIGSDGNPITDVSEFAKVLDYIEIMNYAIWGSWDNFVGPNAPLNDSCAPVADQAGSAVSEVMAWGTAGFPANRMILGVASYGTSFRVNQSSALDASGNIKLYAPFDKSQQPAGDKWGGTAGGVDECGNPNGVGGVFDFWGLIDAGFLLCDGMVAKGIDYTFDNCSKTPYVYNSTSQVMVSFDNALSFAAKGQFVKDAGLAGFAMWQAGGDYNDILLDAIKSAVDSEVNSC